MATMRSRIHSKLIITLLVLAASLAIAAACGPTTPQTPATPAASTPALESAPTDVAILPTAPPAGGESYPAPAAVETVNPYPGEGQAALPPTMPPEAYPPAEETFQEPRFRIDPPVAANATTITGQAPPGVALAIMDVTYNGVLLGSGRSDDSGRFTIPVSGLVAGNRIGLTVGELAEGQTLNQMAEQYYPHRGEGFMNLPNVGIFFDTIQVSP